jgi:hypothetical protein
MKRLHKDVDFAVDDASGAQKIFGAFAEACALAVTLAACDGRPHNVDVLIHSKAGARAFGGDDCVENYLEDPDASVSERIEVRAEAKGRVA